MKALDLIFSRLLQYDLSREDLTKWVSFARRVFAVMLGAIVLAAGISGLYSTRQSQSLLYDSLFIQGKAVAESVARAAYVPLTLNDRESLRLLVESLSAVENLAYVSVLDAGGGFQVEASFNRPPENAVEVRTPVVAPKEFQGTSADRPLGEVVVRLSSKRVAETARRVAWLNVFVSGLLILLVSVVGILMIGQLVSRMQELVGEARLVEQIRQANAELESFSYSVSHDLRAPLRSITGFTQILAVRAGSKLDEESRGHLERVVLASRRMARIIDDILALSRVGRRELARQRVDLSALAERVLADLREREPARKVETSVQRGLTADCDPGLVQIALENLLGNAWKYTSKTAGARVEFSARREGGQTVYEVRDNGAGFDPRYSQKLFQPFQRLHKESDFEGTGVGLATVKRIVQRHGGRVWAEAEPEKGAVFRFTLAPQGGR